MKQIIEAFTIFSKYTDAECVTHCEHDVLYVNIDYNKVSEEDRKRLEELGFRRNIEYRRGFQSYKFGSC
jgi:hypothetical protein